MPFPRYADLPRPDATGLPLANGVWGPDDQLGTLNNLTPQNAADAARLVREGRRFNLDLPLHLPFDGFTDVQANNARKAPRPTLFKPDGMGLLTRDDKLDDFFLQGSSQWDALTHIGDPEHGFYNGLPRDETKHGPGARNGIDNVAEFCIFTRGVLADLPRYFASIGERWSPVESMVCSAEQLRAALAQNGITVRQGDVVLVRTGWLETFLAADIPNRMRIFRERKYSGLSPGEDTWEFIWDSRMAALASDNVTVEKIPRVEGKAHLHWSIARLGITIGELFALDGLAEACAKHGRYEFLFVSKPLNLRGGVGSPPNAMAVW